MGRGMGMGLEGGRVKEYVQGDGSRVSRVKE